MSASTALQVVSASLTIASVKEHRPPSKKSKRKKRRDLQEQKPDT